jgi:hypothetical protein
MAVETYRFSAAGDVGLESVTLFTTHFAAGTVAGPARLSVRGAWARGTVALPDGDAELSGLVDTELRVDWDVLPDELTLTARGFLPTGVATLDPEQSVVASVLSSDLLPFRVSSLGTGGGVFLEGAASHRFGGLGAGISLGWGRSGELEPLEGESVVYRPGSQWSARVALDGELGPAVKGSVRLGFRRYGDDTMDGRNLFQPGNRLEGLVSVGFPTVRGGSAAVYAGLFHRENGTALLETLADAPSQDLLLAGAVWRVALGGTWIQPRADARLFRSEDGVGQGFQLGVGSSAEIEVGSEVTLVPVLIARIGNVEVREGLSSGFTGAELGVSVRFGR